MKKIILLLAVFAALNAESQVRRIGVLGSSSANGQGVPTDSAWAMKLKKYYLGLNLIDTLHRIAASTYDCYSGMPTGYIPPPGRNSPNISYNITRLMTRTPMPTTIIVSYPNTNYNIFSDQEILFCLDSIKKYANAMGAVCFIATTQPRDNYDDAGRARLKYLNELIKNYFGYYAIDFFTPLNNPANNRLRPEYALGDGVHINSRGHEVLFQQVLAKNIFNIDPGSIRRTLIDVGQAATTTSTDQWGRHWNNMTDSRKGIRINNAVTTNNQVTTLKLEVVNPIGTTSSTDPGVASGGAAVIVQEYPASVVTDHAFANPTITNGKWRLYDLNPALTYTIKFWGNRNLSGYRIIQIKRSDETTWTEYNASLNTKYNQAAIFSFSGKTEMSFDIRVKSGSAQGCISLIDIITNLPLNQAPVANAGADISMMLPLDSMQLNGSASFDPDGNISQFRWQILSGPGGALFNNPLIAEPVLRNLTAGAYTLELQVTDDRFFSDKDTIQIKVEVPKLNQLPVVNAGDDVEIFLPLDSVQLTGEGVDSDGAAVGSNWRQISGPSTAVVTRPDSLTTVVKELIVGEYVFELAVTDDSLATAKDTVKVVVHPPNELPIANAGIDGQITLPVDSFLLDGSSSTDSDGTIKSYHWKKISGPEQGSVSNADSAKSTAINLVAGAYVFELAVTDNRDSVDSDLVTVTVFPALNRPPLANAGEDSEIYQPVDSIRLSGIGIDNDGVISSFTWSQVQGPSLASIIEPTNANTLIKDLVPGEYLFELVVMDDSLAAAKDTVKVLVHLPNQFPIANGGGDGEITLPVNTFLLDGTLSNDPDGTIKSYHWKKLSGPSGDILSDSAAVKTTVTDLVEGTYVFELTVTDNWDATDSDLVTVIVLPIPNRPPVANAGVDRTITLPKDSVHLSGTATDPDNNVTTYAWAVISGPSSYLFNDPSVSTPVITGLVQGQYVFELTVTDAKGLSDKDTAVITINAQPIIVNERILIDFGQATNTTASPDQWGKYWNNVTDTRKGIRLSNAIATDNRATSVKFEVVNPIGTAATYDPGVSTGGPTGNVGDYPYSAATDNAFANINITNGRWRIYDLDPQRIYTIKFWGSRNMSGSRFIQIKTTEETTWKEYNASLNTNFNTAAVFTISGKTEVSFDIRVKSGSTFGYINVIDINSTAAIISNPLVQRAESMEMATSAEASASVYPNPASNRVILQLRNNYTGIAEVYISNVHGAVLKQVKIIKPTYHSTYNLDLESWPKGIYFLEVRMLGKKEIVRFVKL